jgi:hypothetical protein
MSPMNNNILKSGATIPIIVAYVMSTQTNV